MSTAPVMKENGWVPYRDAVGHDLAWPIDVWPRLWSPQLQRARSVLLARSPGAPEDRPLPLVVFLDGQNLFDPATAYGGWHWWLGEILESLSADGIHCVVAGVTNGGTRRLQEYAPFLVGPSGRTLADATLAFLVDTVLPAIEARTSISSRAADRGLVGASLGGSLALYGAFSRPETFGLCGALSPSLQVRKADLFRFVRRSSEGPKRIYLDVGTREVSRPRGQRFNSRHYSANVTAMRDLLRKKGYRQNQTMLHVREPRGVHHETAWARRLPRALRFLLTGRDPQRRAPRRAD